MNAPYFIGISGGSASGKTAFIHALQQTFGPEMLCLVSQDNYYKTADQHLRDENGYINFDLPECIDVSAFLGDLALLRTGQEIRRHEYLFQLEDQAPPLIALKPAPVIIVEGLFLFHFREVFEQLDLKLFIDAREEIKLERRLKRDTAERGIDEDLVRYQWEHHVKPSYDRFLKPYQNEADIIINNNEHFLTSLQVISNHIKTLL